MRSESDIAPVHVTLRYRQDCERRHFVYRNNNRPEFSLIVWICCTVFLTCVHTCGYVDRHDKECAYMCLFQRSCQLVRHLLPISLSLSQLRQCGGVVHSALPDREREEGENERGIRNDKMRNTLPILYISPPFLAVFCSVCGVSSDPGADGVNFWDVTICIIQNKSQTTVLSRSTQC